MTILPYRNRLHLPLGTLVCILAVLFLPWAVQAQSDQNSYDEYNLQWELETINAGAAYQYLYDRQLPMGGDGVVIAISDAGIEDAHPELAHAFAG